MWFDDATRGVYATDSSNYRHVPIGVVCPMDAEDAAAAMRVCAEADVPILARGAGTSLAGQACNVAVILDASRHMTRILEIDSARRIARVEPGVVLDDLRRATELHGLTFGPDPATHAWCTIGGMIGNNSCGAHALYAGKTVDNVERLRVLLYGGEALDFGRDDPDATETGTASTGLAASIHARLATLIHRVADDVRAGFPVIPRRVSGYNLDQLLPENGFDVARALVGTESTCVFVTEATLRLVPSPAHRRLVIIGFGSVFDAADAVPGLLAHSLLALEGFDGVLIDQMRSRRLHLDAIERLPFGNAWLLAEFGGDTDAEVESRAASLLAALEPGLDARRFDTEHDQRAMWLVRESGLAATAIKADGSHNLEGWEDAAVAPERLGAYLRGIAALWTEFGISGAWYGHFGQGCVHTRNDFDFGSVAGLRAYRAYVERAADLVVSLGGSLSGEHGDGQARGELLERMYGPRLIEAFREFKQIFDPRGRMNPGRVVDALPLDANLRGGPDRQPISLGPTHFAFATDAGSLRQAAQRCVGVGRCRRDDSGTMCPSFRATREEVHSTRGRAKLLVEMFEGEITPASWRNEDVRQALDLCLSCKGCASDCPTGVDMATYKSEFLAHHYAGRLRPASAYALGLIPWTARLATRLPRVTNGMLDTPGIGKAARRLAGITTRRALPRFARGSLRRSAVARDRADRLDASVVVWPDTFTDAFRPEVGKDLIAILEALDERVAVPRSWACCGRPLYDQGMLGLAARSLRRLLDVLEPWTSRRIPVIVPEPSCLAAFRDELPGLLAADPRSKRLAALARSPAEHLLENRRLGSVAANLAAVEPPRRIVIQTHCHARAIGSHVADATLLGRLGYDAEIADAGCCGLAGSFGFRAEHEALSRRIGDEQWLPRLRGALEGSSIASTLVVDGFSCATQLQHLSSQAAVPLVSLIRERVLAAAKPPIPTAPAATLH